MPGGIENIDNLFSDGLIDKIAESNDRSVDSYGNAPKAQYVDDSDVVMDDYNASEETDDNGVTTLDASGFTAMIDGNDSRDSLNSDDSNDDDDSDVDDVFDNEFGSTSVPFQSNDFGGDADDKFYADENNSPQNAEAPQDSAQQGVKQPSRSSRALHDPTSGRGAKWRAGSDLSDINDGDEEEYDDECDDSADSYAVERNQQFADGPYGVGDAWRDYDPDSEDEAQSERATNTRISPDDVADGAGSIDNDDDGVEVPQWVVSLRSKLYSSVAHAFLLHGNVRDYMVRNVTIRDGIVQVLDPQFATNDAYFDVIATYDQAHGLMFYGNDVQYEDGRKLSDVYKARFVKQMNEAQDRLSLRRTDDVPNKDTVMLFTIISDIFIHHSHHRAGKMLLFIDYADFLVPDASSAQMKPDERKLAITLADIGRSAEADSAGNCMIFTTDDISQLSTRIRSSESRIEQIKVPLPDTDDRQDFIDNVLDIPENTLSDGTQIFSHPDTIDKNVFAINSAGLSRMQIEDIMLRALSEDEPLTMQLMKERKNDIIKEDYDDVLEIVDPKFGFERVGGMEQLKNFFREEIIEPIHSGDTVSVPMGVLLSGSPGVSKTFISKALAHEAGMNFVALNLNRIMEKWVGSTERNLERALDCAMAMAPTIIFIDEIDEALPNRADPNASAVNKRINQRLLTFFSETEHRGQVLILAATNYPNKIDPAFKRAGRFDMRIPMFAPDEFDRMRIMQIIAKSCGYSFSWFESPDELIENPFKCLAEWLAEGNIPIATHNFCGDTQEYTYVERDKITGASHKQSIQLYKRVARVVNKERITLQEFYEAERILFDDMPQRVADASTAKTISNDEFYKQIGEYIFSKTDILGDDEKNLQDTLDRIWRWEIIYKVFSQQTFRMTGAELDVVMNKAISLWRRWKRKNGSDEVVKRLIMRGDIIDENDIPWQPFLLDACHKTVNATAGIKSMEDDALLNASDSDFVPDALYARTDDGRLISYAERHEELLAQQEHQR